MDRLSETELSWPEMVVTDFDNGVLGYDDSLSHWEEPFDFQNLFFKDDSFDIDNNEFSVGCELDVPSSLGQGATEVALADGPRTATHPR